MNCFACFVQNPSSSGFDQVLGVATIVIAIVAVIISIANSYGSSKDAKEQREDEAVLRLVESLTSAETESHRARLKVTLSKGSYSTSDELKMVESYLAILRSIAKAGVVFDFCRPTRRDDQIDEENSLKEPGRAWNSQYLTLLWLLAEMAEDAAAIRGNFLQYWDDKRAEDGKAPFDEDARTAANRALQRIGVGPRVGQKGVEHPEGLGR